jgi:hypothetical protein
LAGFYASHFPKTALFADILKAFPGLCGGHENLFKQLFR